MSRAMSRAMSRTMSRAICCATSPAASRARVSGAAAICLGLSVLLAACASSNPADGAAAGSARAATTAAAGTEQPILTVLAAASLTESFGQLARRYEAAHPGTRVVLSLGASSTLAQQAAAGAPADVLATASPASMEQAAQAGVLAGAAVDFAQNRISLVVPAANRAGIHTLADLTRPGVTLARCADQVPCGAAALDVLGKAGIDVVAASRESDVKAVLTKLTLGEVDAGFVYATDLAAAQSAGTAGAAGTGSALVAIPLPPQLGGHTAYRIARLAAAPNPAGAQAFVALVRSAEGQGVLRAAGFEPPALAP